jgi:DNA-binding transcriptional LysR family regulator
MQICMIEWSDIRYVVAVERHRTLTAAAKALGCDQSTVTRRLAILQEALGAQILERREGKYVLTTAGERLRPYLEGIEAQALALERVAQGHDTKVTGAVRMTTIETLATHFLAPRLLELRRRAPDIDLQIDVDRRALDLGRREADLALRIGRPRQPQLIGRKIGVLGIALYASPDYLARAGTPRPGQSAQRHSVIADAESNAWMPEERWLAAQVPDAHVALRSNSWLTRFAAARASLGIAPLPCFVAESVPGLLRIGGPNDRTERELWLIVHRDLQRVARVRAVMQIVTDLATGHAAMLAGDR